MCTSEEAALHAAGEGLYAALKSTCLIRRAALHLSQREFEPALEAGYEHPNPSPSPNPNPNQGGLRGP